MLGRLGASLAITLTLTLPVHADEPVTSFTLDNGLKVLALQKSERGLEEVFKELTKG